MARLIDANELKQRILEERDKIPLTLPCAVYELRIDKPNHHGNAIRGGIRKALHCMEQCKTVDAAPVVHGHWDEGKYHGYCCCSNCRDVYILKEWLVDGKWNYCPNCGAKMDGE